MKRILTATLSTLMIVCSAQANPIKFIALKSEEVFKYLAGAGVGALRTVQVTAMPTFRAERKLVYLVAGQNNKFTVTLSRDFKPGMTEMNIDIFQKLDSAAKTQLAKIPNSHRLTGYYYPHADNVNDMLHFGQLGQKVLPPLSEVEDIGRRVMTNLRNVEGLEPVIIGTEPFFDLYNRHAVQLRTLSAGPRRFPLGVVADLHGDGKAAVYRLQVGLHKETTLEEIARVLEAVSEAFY